MSYYCLISNNNDTKDNDNNHNNNGDSVMVMMMTTMMTMMMRLCFIAHHRHWFSHLIIKLVINKLIKLGLTGPVLLPAKRVLQRTCPLKLQWDEKLPDDLLRSWTKWREQLELLNQVNIPRCYFPGGCHAGKSFQLHHFSDASEIILLALSFNFCIP